MPPLHIIYCPYPSLDAAREAAVGLLEAQLVACCNLLAASESLYWWQGKLATNPETVLIAKTSGQQAEAARRWIEASHPYETPAVLSFLATANPSCAAWAELNTKDAAAAQNQR